MKITNDKEIQFQAGSGKNGIIRFSDYKDPQWLAYWTLKSESKKKNRFIKRKIEPSDTTEGIYTLIEPLVIKYEFVPKQKGPKVVQVEKTKQC